MGSYDELTGSFETWSVVVTEDAAASLVAIGGYTHPLFTDPAFAAASPFGRAPLPGQAVLLLMGGLVEQTGRFDAGTIGLVGFDAVRFVSPAFPGDRIRVAIEVLGKEPGTTTGVVVMSWRALNERDETLVEATARMLFRAS